LAFRHSAGTRAPFEYITGVDGQNKGVEHANLSRPAPKSKELLEST
jgi:hypothetical protein